MGENLLKIPLNLIENRVNLRYVLYHNFTLQILQGFELRDQKNEPILKIKGIGPQHMPK